MKFVRSPTGCLASTRHHPSLQRHPFPFRPHHIPYRFISKPCCRHLVDHHPSLTASSCHTRRLASRPSLRTMLSLEPYFIFIFKSASFHSSPTDSGRRRSLCSLVAYLYLISSPGFGPRGILHHAIIEQSSLLLPLACHCPQAARYVRYESSSVPLPLSRVRLLPWEREPVWDLGSLRTHSKRGHCVD